MSHSRTVKSDPALASQEPPGSKATSLTALPGKPLEGLCASSGGPSGRRARTSHNRTVASSAPLASVRPSGLNSTLVMTAA